jgi:phospholipid/cholesterol/gamma-HCH transport system ATP-binding protein
MARIEQTELTEAISKYPSELSGGMQKRAALARALITDPQIVLFDEPTTGQDPVRKNAILSMIAQYQRKFNFTAILVSHEIPDVYFISNRILALYDRRIVFEGTPEELENFDHPFMDEVISSLEALQKELTGLYSKRQFGMLNHLQLNRRAAGESYCVVVFSLKELNAIITKVGHDAAQEALRNLGLYVDKHFGAIGGFSTRRNTNEIITMLPYSNLAETESIMDDFVQDFRRQVITAMGVGTCQLALGEAIELNILAGIAEGQPTIDIESVIALAKSQQKEIGRLNCVAGGVNT